MEASAVEQIRAWLVDLPMTLPFASARSALTARRIVVLSVDRAGVNGWGEAAPVPGHTDESADEIWASLRLLLAEYGTDAATQAAGILSAAFAQAADDASAKLRNQPLWQAMEGSPQLMASAAIGVDGSGRPDARQVHAAATSGYKNMKLKITPECQADDLRRIVAAHPGIVFAADANGSLRSADRGSLEALDAVGLAYLEQPGDRHDLKFHREIRAFLKTPIALDESAANPDDIPRILAADAADVINLKTGRLGPSRALRLAESITAEGVGVRLGGLIESGIGRAHTAALAGNPIFAWPSDLASSDRYFLDDLVRPQWRVSDGAIHLPAGPGIGVVVERTALDAYSVASLSTVESG